MDPIYLQHLVMDPIFLQHLKHHYFVTHWSDKVVNLLIKHVIFSKDIFDEMKIKDVLEKYNNNNNNTNRPIIITKTVGYNYNNNDDDDENRSGSGDENEHNSANNNKLDAASRMEKIPKELDFSTKVQICRDFLNKDMILKRRDDNNGDVLSLSHHDLRREIEKEKEKENWIERVKEMIEEIMREIQFVSDAANNNNNNHDEEANDDIDEKKAACTSYDISQEERVVRIQKFRTTLEKVLSEIKHLLTITTSGRNNNNNNNNNNNKTFLEKIKKRIKKSNEDVLVMVQKKYNFKDGWQKMEIQAALFNHLNNYPNEKHLSQFILSHLGKELGKECQYDDRGRRLMKKMINKLDRWHSQCVDAIIPNWAFSSFVVPLTLELDDELNVDRVDRGMMINVNVKLYEEDGDYDNQILDIKSPQGMEPKVFIISGDAGTGKSMLLSSMFTRSYITVYTRFYDTSFMHSLFSDSKINEAVYGDAYNFVFYINFRNNRKNIVMEFDHFLEDTFPQTLKFFNLEQIKKTLSESKCLVLCDEYDDAWDRRFFESLISFQPETWRIVITTRPGGTKKLTSVAGAKWSRENVINLRVLGIDKENTKTFVNQFINFYGGKEEDDAANRMFHEFMNIGPGENNNNNESVTIKDIIKTPLYFNDFAARYFRNYYYYDHNKDSEDANPVVVEARDEKNLKLYYFLIQYMTQENYKQKIIIEKTGIESSKKSSLKNFDDVYLRGSLENYKNGMKCELTEEEFRSVFQFPYSLCFDLTNHFDVIISYYFDVKNKRRRKNGDKEEEEGGEGGRGGGDDDLKESSIETVYCYRYAKELEFATARKICEDIMAKEREYATARKICDNIMKKSNDDGDLDEAKILLNIFNEVLIINGIAEIDEDQSDVSPPPPPPPPSSQVYHPKMKILFPELRETVIELYQICSRTSNLKKALYEQNGRQEEKPLSSFLSNGQARKRKNNSIDDDDDDDDDGKTQHPTKKRETVLLEKLCFSHLDNNNNNNNNNNNDDDNEKYIFPINP